MKAVLPATPPDGLLRVARGLVFPFAVLICLLAGLYAGPHARALYQRLNPPPDFVVGDFSALHAKAGADIVLFTHSRCPWCPRAREILVAEGLPFREFEIDTSSEARALFHDLGDNAVPVMIVGDRKISGFRESVLRETLTVWRERQNAPASHP